MSRRVLVIDDDRNMCELLQAGLARRGFEVAWRTNPAEGLALFAAEEFAVVVTDVNMPGVSGTEVARRCAKQRPDVPVLVITAFGSLETAIEAIRAGAYDYVPKPLEVPALALTLERAIQHRELREEVKRLRRAVADVQRPGAVLGASPAIRELNALIARIGPTESTVLVTGETGTGKEVVARALHAASKRAEGPFVAINCGALPEAILESELFGHVKGAFTDAKSDRPGLIIKASGGTLFLDEIGEMPLPVQPKLLRVLQERTVRPVGSDVDQPFDVRIVAATNKDLETAVQEKRFREDLFYRLSVIPIALPPLRSRGNDVLLLAQHFLETFAARAGKSVTGIATPAAEKLLAYPWPGNVRELQNCLERAVAMTQHDKLVVDDLPEKVRAHRSSHVIVASEDPEDLPPMAEVEKRYVLRVMEAVQGNKTLAAKILGFDRKTLYRKLEQYAPDAGGAKNSDAG